MTGHSQQQQQQRAATGCCQAKWECQVCVVLAPCLLSVPSVLKPKQIQMLLFSSRGGLIRLTNEHFP